MLKGCAIAGGKFDSKSEFHLSENYYKIQKCSDLEKMKSQAHMAPEKAARVRLGLESYPYAIPPDVMRYVIETHTNNVIKVLSRSCEQ